jgi:hypothetical protein
MKRKTAHIDIRVEPELIKHIDAWRNQQRVPPTRSAAVVHMIEIFLAGEDPPRPGWWLPANGARRSPEPDTEC